MAKELTRREFFKAAPFIGAGAGAAMAGIVKGIKDGQARKDPVFHIEFDETEGLSYWEATRLALSLDRLYDLFPPQITPVTPEDARNWIFEVVPQFAYEGAVDQAVYPSDAKFFITDDGQVHNHIAGRSDCESYTTNYRFANPHSAWFQDVGWITTTIHELVHVQQGQECGLQSRENIENTAQIVTWEVAAGMLNQGNECILFPLIDELRGVMVSAAWGLALKEGRIGEFERFRKRINTTPDSEARYEKAKRQWVGKEANLMWMLETYNVEPLNRLIKAIRFDNNEIYDLALPPKFEFPFKYINRTFKVDDTAYFLAHAEKIARYYAQK